MRLTVVLMTLLMLVSPLRAAEVPTVAAASDLRFAMDELVAAYGRETGRQVKVSYGSSGIFRQQIANGAPFELFLSADEDYVWQLHRARLTRDWGVLYALGRIVLFAPKGSRLPVDGQMEGLRRALAEGRLRRFAIANPDHAPYGARASEALRHAGLWTGLEKRLVLGENVSQALQFASTGGADGGIIALSLVKAPGFQNLGSWALIPADWHQPLRQRMVLTRRSGPEARDFYRWLQGPAARGILVRHCFVLPGEAG